MAVRQRIADFFGGLERFEISELVLLLAIAVIDPWSWQTAVWVYLLLLANTVAKAVWKRGVRNSLTRGARSSMILSMVFFAIYLLSMLYTSNLEAGWTSVAHKLSFVLLPAYFLCSDLGYIGKERLRVLMYGFVFSCCVMFLVYIGKPLWRIVFEGASGNVLFGSHKLVRHHTYYAMYFLLALAFLFYDVYNNWRSMNKGWKVLLGVCAAMLILFMVFIQSRSGILCLMVLIVWTLVTLFVRKYYRAALIGVAVAVAGCCGVYLLVGQKHHRLTQTVVATTGKGKRDIRFDIAENALQVIGDHWVLGVGVGDRIDELDANRQKTHGVEDEKSWHHYNPHNQYLDTWVATGLLGFLTLLALLLIPFIRALKQRPHNEMLLALIFIVGCSALFESVFERQMGIVFFCYFYGLLQLEPEELAVGD